MDANSALAAAVSVLGESKHNILTPGTFSPEVTLTALSYLLSVLFVL
jgi:hypothetical protein